MTRVFFIAILAFMAPKGMHAANPACQPVADAMAKIYTTPVRIYSTETAVYTGGKTRSSQTIYLNHSTYVQVNGQWRSSPLTQQEVLEMKKEQQDKNSSATCRAVRDESVNGESAVLYSLRQETPDAKIDSQIWLSKSRGVPLKTEIEMDIGGKFGKSHRIMRFEYTNVQAPPGFH